MNTASEKPVSILIENCHVISPDYDAEGIGVRIEGTRIQRLYAPGESPPAVDQVIDAAGCMVMPGFIDVHSHGRSGYDFTDATCAAMDRIAAGKLSEGVTTLLPTTMTLPEDRLAASLQTAADYVKAGAQHCKVPGVHLEGPFINPAFIGAQNPDYVRPPDIAEVRRLSAIHPVIKVSYSIETDHDGSFTTQLQDEGIVASCVHSAATYAQYRRLADSGLKNLSHFCNQMSPLHHREIGLVGVGLLHDEVYVELICDTIHVTPDMLRLILRIRGAENVLVITDSMRAAGMADGDCDSGGLQVTVKDGVARLRSNGAIAGSTAPYYLGLTHLHEATGLPVAELVKATSWFQAQSLGLDRLGKIEAGYFADIVMLDDAFQPQAVWVNGELRWGAAKGDAGR